MTKSVEVLFYPMLHDLRKFIAFFWNVPKLRAFVYSGKRNMKMKMSTKHSCNEFDRGEPKYWLKTLFQCHFVHHKYQTELSRIE
jgi:N-acyl-L-homoserine lactone synthetase